MSFAEFTQKVSRDYPNYHWHYIIDDGIYVAKCDEWVICYNPASGNIAMGIIL